MLIWITDMCDLEKTHLKVLTPTTTCANEGERTCRTSGFVNVSHEPSSRIRDYVSHQGTHSIPRIPQKHITCTGKTQQFGIKKKESECGDFLVVSLG